MKEDLLKLLACPSCRHDLDLKTIRGTPDFIEFGHLQCRECGELYEIKDDIPFFSPIVQHGGVKNQQETYSTWWDDYHDEQSIVDSGNPDFFYNSLQIRAEEFDGRVVLDAGCGNGRFSFVVSHYRPRLLVSFDLSSGVAHARKAIAKHNPGANVAYVQGDITHPPFKEGVFDVVFSWGVIHHTPETRQTFSTISGLAREGGTMGVYVYEFHPHYRYNRQSLSLMAYLRSLLLIRPFRFVCSRLPARIVHLLFVPIYSIEKFLGVGVMGCHGTPEDRWNHDRYFRVVIDRFKTRYASEHQLEEVIGWFRENGFNDLRVGWRPRISISAVRSKKKAARIIDLSISNDHETDEGIASYLARDVMKETG